MLHLKGLVITVILNPRPCGGHIVQSFLFLVDSFWQNIIMICCKCHIVADLHHLMVWIWELLAKHWYFVPFLVKIASFGVMSPLLDGKILVLEKFPLSKSYSPHWAEKNELSFVKIGPLTKKLKKITIFTPQLGSTPCKKWVGGPKNSNPPRVA